MLFPASDIFSSNSSEVEFEEWSTRRDRAALTNKIVWTGYCAIIFFASISMAILVIGIRKRREFFSFATLICFVIYASIRLPYYLLEDFHKLPWKARPYLSISI